MVSKIDSQKEANLAVIVLILVLMEYKWNASVILLIGLLTLVLILVLMEYKWNT